MGLRLRRFFGVRSGEGLPVLLAFLYIAVVVAAFLLAKPIRNGLFLHRYGPYALVYVYAAVPLALTAFVPVYSRVAARFGQRTVTIWTLVFFSGNVLLFWYAFRYLRFEWLPAVFYVWVNCFGVIAPVQAWSFANSLFDTRQARRLFGLIGAGASLGAIAGGLLVLFLVEPVGGTVNMMLVLAGLILLAAGIVTIASMKTRRPRFDARPRIVRHPFSDSMRQIARSRYLRLIASLVFLVAVATQWTAFQLSLVAALRFGGNADAITRFYGTFTFGLGAATFLLQLLLTGPALRRFGLAVTILVLPLSLGVGSALIFLAPAFWSVLLTGGFDQGFRFSIDKATYELLYLPLPQAVRTSLKNTIDIVFNRFADAIGALLLGLATRGFAMVPGLGLGLRGTAAINIGVIAVWAVVAWRLRVEYVRTIRDSIHRNRIDTEPARALDRSAVEALCAKLGSADAADVRAALDLVEERRLPAWHPAVRDLLTHAEADIRRRALAILRASGDRTVASRATGMLRDPDLGVRTEALLYLSREAGVDPLRRIEELGEFEDFSIRAAMAAFLASPGPSQNLDAARAILEAMVRSEGPAGARDRAEAARLLALVPGAFNDLVRLLIADEEIEVARDALGCAPAADELIPDLVNALASPDLAGDASAALARFGERIVPDIERRLHDTALPIEIRRELPGVLVGIGTPSAEQAVIESLLQADAALRYRVVASLNKLRETNPHLWIDPRTIEVLLAAEIAGHYRSYQALGPLRAGLEPDSVALAALGHAMEQELERIFRLMALAHPIAGLHDAYVGVRSPNPVVRANALEFLDNVLAPDLRHVLVPLIDGQVSVDERIALANRLVGAPLETAKQAVTTLLASEDGWLRSCAVYAVGALQLHDLEPEVRKFESTSDPILRDSVQATLQRLSPETDEAKPAFGSY